MRKFDTRRRIVIYDQTVCLSKKWKKNSIWEGFYYLLLFAQMYCSVTNQKTLCGTYLHVRNNLILLRILRASGFPEGVTFCAGKE